MAEQMQMFPTELKYKSEVWPRTIVAIISVVASALVSIFATLALIPEPEEIAYLEFRRGDLSMKVPADGDFEFDGDMDALLGPVQTTTNSNSQGKGIGINSGAGDIGLDFDFTSPEANAGSASSLGGSANMALQAILKSTGGGSYILFGIGGLLVVVGAIIAGVFKQLLRGLTTAGFGIGLIAVTFLVQYFPWVLLLIPLAVIIGVVVMFLDARKTHAHELTSLSFAKMLKDKPIQEAAVIKDELIRTAQSIGHAKGGQATMKVLSKAETQVK